MRNISAIWGLVAFGVVWVPVTDAQHIRYRGPVPGAATGHVELAPGQVREIAVGEEIPGWGRVIEIAETHLTVERPVSAAEQARLRQEGKAVYEVLEIRIPRAGPGGAPLRPVR